MKEYNAVLDGDSVTVMALASGDVYLLTRWSGDVHLGPVDSLRLGWALVRAGIRSGLS